MSRVAIVGCGAMGSVYAGLMADSGHEVIAIDIWQEHVDAINQHGLRVEGASGNRTVNIKATNSTVGLPTYDLVIIATKAFDVKAASNSARTLIGKNTVVQTIQNGIGAQEKVAETIGEEQLAIGVVGGFGASFKAPGHVHHNGMEMIRFGAYSNLSGELLEQSAAIWESSGFKTQLFTDVQQMLWEKLIMNVAFSGTTCSTGLTIGEVIANKDAWDLARKCSLEAIEVANRLNIKIDVGDPIEHVKKLGSKIPNAKPSMLLDHLDKKRSEIDYINGGITKIAREIGLNTPVNDTVVSIIKARESSYLI
ncbi:2-dehydropantoate 2-reductase [Halomonas sp. QX-2]|uniref:2-dehydropantoate 2-reductase n=1 Tax=Vreelandella sedimenti TaxID=2729618 RepID=A0A7Z0SPA0_9GAMM|nr:2-dehydropantoate 2-reductase [Halomonas sedimenti]NYT73746.1 2-dehydropantoate 2-reductase [Halomonas sedimenti]